MELSRPVRPWEFLSAVGRQAGILGYENGRVEAWVYPLKLLRNFELAFHAGQRKIAAAALARTLITRPEATTVLYASDSFSVKETFFVPLDEPGAVILLEIETLEPLEVEAGFERDFQLMWPAALGATYANWDDKLGAFSLGEEQRRFFGLVGAPGAIDARPAFRSNYTSSERTFFRLARVGPGRHTQVIVIAASTESAEAAAKTYNRLAEQHEELRQQAARFYAQYLEQTVVVRLPDSRLEQAYDWARISTIQGLVKNPYLGTGLIAGYGHSGSEARPGFAWFFGRDALWTVLGLNSAGDFRTARTALEFLIRYQRADGKMPHEIAQSASVVPWFEDYPYGYASADATPLFLIAADDYVTRSGDTGFAQDQWAAIWKAYQFLRSTWDARGLAKNDGVGHGWVEGGPLLPVKTELYQSGLGVQALRALARLARRVGKPEVAAEMEGAFATSRTQLNRAFWMPEKQRYAFALDLRDRPVDVASVLATVPMWWDLLDAEKADAMISQLAQPDHATDWGMRILSDRQSFYSPAGYHFGSVWPLFTGWASVGEYRYHRSHPALANLAANALLALDGAAGHATEVLSGSFYEPLSTSTPQQIWSAAMILNPLLRGLLGLEADALNSRLRFAPHVPATWEGFEVRNIKVGEARLDFRYQRSEDTITLDLSRTGTSPLELEFAPAFSPRAAIVAVELNDRPLSFQRETGARDQHVVVRFPVYGGHNTLRIRYRSEFEVEAPFTPPSLGSASRNPRLVSETWDASGRSLALDFTGPAGSVHDFPTRGGAAITRVEGAVVVEDQPGRYLLRVTFPAGDTTTYQPQHVSITFAPP
ncbi:MAG TPA: hypothetical protein VNK82_12015 [Terriglobales bacterium]|nr:hypothetical protein [Terriglobales bacterium]